MNKMSYKKGVFHLHSHYSHDGRDSIHNISENLFEQGFSFCILTDHFEDFDANKLTQYLYDIESENKRKKCVIIPGIEKDIQNNHVIFFPIAPSTTFESLQKIKKIDDIHRAPHFKVLAHPTKSAPEFGQKLIDLGCFDFIEVWNQQVDGNTYPNFNWLKSVSVPNRILFGTDIHKIQYPIHNEIRLHNSEATNIVEELLAGRYELVNNKSGIECPNSYRDFIAVLTRVEKTQQLRIKAKRTLKIFLKMIYEWMPLKKKPIVNHFKNTIRSRL